MKQISALVLLQQRSTQDLGYSIEMFLKKAFKLYVHPNHTCVFIFVPEQGAALLEDLGAKITGVHAVFQPSLLVQSS